MNPSITLRPIDSEDDEFLFQLFRSANEDKFIPLGLPAEQLSQLLATQFQAQERQYRWGYANPDLDIVMAEGVPIGRFYVWRGQDETVLIDITIAPEHRSLGIGSALVGRLLSEGRRAGKPVRAHVEKTNRAQRLWLRLGFQIVEDTGIYLRLGLPVESVAHTTRDQASGAEHIQEAVCD